MAFHGFAAFQPYANDEEKRLRPFAYSPRPLQDDDVDVSVEVCGVCHSDVHSVKNDWGNGKFPIVAGHEVIGTVVALGPKVQNLKLGDRVGIGPTVGSCARCEECRKGQEQLCSRAVGCYNGKDHLGYSTYGGFSDRVRCNSKFAFPIPTKLSSAEAAPLLCAGITVFSPLKRWTRPGMKVGIIGIGGLGHIAIQFARAMGCDVMALSTSDDKKTEALRFGATFVNSKDKTSMRAARRSLDFILNTTNAQLPWGSYLSLLRNDGRFCFVGIPLGKIKLNVGHLMFRRLSLCGSPVGSCSENIEMLQLAAEKGVRAQVEMFPMSDVNQAIERVIANKARYRCVLRAKL